MLAPPSRADELRVGIATPEAEDASPQALSLSSRHADPSGVDLLMSVFITEERRVATLNTKEGRNRFPRAPTTPSR